MTIRKLPEDNRRLKRLTILIEQSLWYEIRSRYMQYDMIIASIHVSKDLRQARINVFSPTITQIELLKTLHDLRIPVQRMLSTHNLRNTPILSFFWDSKQEFFYKIQKDIPNDNEEPPQSS